MKIAVELEPRADKTPKVKYTWDADTEILSALLKPGSEASGLSGSVGLEGEDGSWVILDVNGGRINAVEVAVWPEVHARATLAVPTLIEDASVLIPAARSSREIRSVEVPTNLTAESCPAKKIIHFRLGNPAKTRAIRLATDILLDVDAGNRVAGLWLLNVPPCPSPT
ncbi:MAG: hypothetical protein ABIR92_00745 [Gemmatimonadaceae bacterium]